MRPRCMYVSADSDHIVKAGPLGVQRKQSRDRHYLFLVVVIILSTFPKNKIFG